MLSHVDQAEATPVSARSTPAVAVLTDAEMAKEYGYAPAPQTNPFTSGVNPVGGQEPYGIPIMSPGLGIGQTINGDSTGPLPRNELFGTP